MSVSRPSAMSVGYMRMFKECSREPEYTDRRLVMDDDVGKHNRHHLEEEVKVMPCSQIADSA